MKNLTFKITTLSVLALLIIVTVASSCRKKETCEGRVFVVDTAGVLISGATVKLYAPNGQVTYDGLTDGSGLVSFEIKLPAIFNVAATKATYPGMAGTGILRVDEPGKKDEVTVKIQ